VPVYIGEGMGTSTSVLNTVTVYSSVDGAGPESRFFVEGQAVLKPGESHRGQIDPRLFKGPGDLAIATKSER